MRFLPSNKELKESLKKVKEAGLSIAIFKYPSFLIAAKGDELIWGYLIVYQAF
jgi:hypothetical protein